MIRWWSIRDPKIRAALKAEDERSRSPTDIVEVMVGEKRAIRHRRTDYFYRNHIEREIQYRLARAGCKPAPGNLTYEIRDGEIVAHGTECEYPIGKLEGESPRLWYCYLRAAAQAEQLSRKAKRWV